jgi:hypothetical protein
MESDASGRQGRLRLTPATLPIRICKNSFCAKEKDENSAAKRAAFQRYCASLAA